MSATPGAPRMDRASKARLVTALVDALARELEAMIESQRAAAEAATHEEAKAEDDKDTRAIEQSYLARGQAARVEELEAALLAVRAMPVRTFAEDAPIALGALVTTLEHDDVRRLLVAPDGGGTTLEGGVLVVTPRAPLGRALLGKTAGDVIELASGPKVRELEVVAVE
jgi:transcription elongation GreA/GreB family factor